MLYYCKQIGPGYLLFGILYLFIFFFQKCISIIWIILIFVNCNSASIISIQITNLSNIC